MGQRSLESEILWQFIKKKKGKFVCATCIVKKEKKKKKENQELNFVSDWVRIKFIAKN